MSGSLSESEYQDMRGRRLNQEESALFTKAWFRRHPDQNITKRHRHPDFQRIYEDFQASRNGVPAQTLYRRFIEAYGLDENKPYDVGHQKRLQALALNSKMHVSLKKQYPRIDWDRLITGKARERKRTIIEIDLYSLPFIQSINGAEVKLV